jgi:hypothetical protein
MAASPPLAPVQGGPIYFVLCDYGPEIGRAYRETDPDHADRETILAFLIRGEYHGPQQVIEVDLAAGRAKDVSIEFAEEIFDRTFLNDLPSDVALFVSQRMVLAKAMSNNTARASR